MQLLFKSARWHFWIVGLLRGANSICSMYVARFVMLALASPLSLEPDGGMVLGAFSNLFTSYRFFKLIVAHDTETKCSRDRLHGKLPCLEISEHVLPVLVLIGTPKLTRFEPAQFWGGTLGQGLNSACLGSHLTEVQHEPASYLVWLMLTVLR